MMGLSHGGGGLNSHGTDAESVPSEQEIDQIGPSLGFRAIDDDDNGSSLFGRMSMDLT
jgi:hypothetical protein